MLIAHIAVHGSRRTARPAIALVIPVMLIMMAGPPAAALDERVLQRLAGTYMSGVFALRVDVHEPNTRVDSMQSPTVESSGWRNHNPGGPVLFHSGSLVEVTGLFNYSDRGFFLEVAEVTEAGVPATDRKRVRIRFMIEPGITALDEQEKKSVELIEMVLGPAEP